MSHLLDEHWRQLRGKDFQAAAAALPPTRLVAPGPQINSAVSDWQR